MVTAARTPRRDRIAIASSIAAHLCVLAMLAAVPHATFTSDDPDERSLLSSIIRIEHRPTPPPLRTVVRQRLAEAVPVPRLAPPVIHAAVAVEHATHRMVVAEEHRAGLAAAPKAARTHVPDAEQPAQIAAAPAKRAVVAAAEATATAAPAASPAPSPVAAQRDEGIGNFSESYPASIDPSSRGSLLAGFNGFVVRITVDENGRATAVEFVRAPADAALRDELRTRLQAAHFIPAACNGLRCAGTVELRT